MANKSTVDIVAQYAQAFRQGYLGNLEVEGVLGRIIRGKCPEDFLTLTDDPTRKLILLTDPLALRAMIGVPAFDLLLRVGWDYPYAVNKIKDGYQVKLVVFREGGNALLCTWDNMIELVGKAYPEINTKLRRWLPELKKLDFKKFDEIEKAYGCDMSAVDHDGSNNPQYMTADRYLAAADTLVNARAFLYFTVHLRELFAGDGSTRDSLGNVGVKEYMALNCPIAELDDAQLIDLKPELPAIERIVFKKRTPGSRIGFPSFYNPDDVGKRYTPRLDWVTDDARFANLRPVSKDTGPKRLLFGIDFQDSFVMPEIKNTEGNVIQEAGELLVSGSVDDVRRFIELIYCYPEELAGVLLSEDMHIPWQIFFPPWWRKRDGSMVAPMTLLTNDAVENGDYYPAVERQWSLNYIKKLGAMMIWPFHCMIGTPGCSLVPALAEAVHWLSVARNIQPEHLFKGTVPKTEHYGPFAPCIEVPNNPLGSLNTILLDRVATYDKIISAGEAEEFCVKTGMMQALDYFGKRHPDALKKIRFLRDCTSMVFPQNRKEADNFLQSMQDQGVVVTESTKLFK